jgi:hypothetical protein
MDSLKLYMESEKISVWQRTSTEMNVNRCREQDRVGFLRIGALDMTLAKWMDGLNDVAETDQDTRMNDLPDLFFRYAYELGCSPEAFSARRAALTAEENGPELY